MIKVVAVMKVVMMVKVVMVRWRWSIIHQINESSLRSINQSINQSTILS